MKKPASLEISDYDKIDVHETLKIAKKDKNFPSKKNPRQHIITGDDYCSARKKWVKKDRIIDRDRDLYEETVIDPETKEILHHQKEHLSKHIGHGSDKQYFKYSEDKKYFEENVFGRSLSDDDIKKYFDFRNPKTKRTEFNKIRAAMFKRLSSINGEKCLLNYKGVCDEKSGFDVDHLIPLSSNILNKKLRNLKPEKGGKVETQSFGSNKLENLIIACKKCNAYKKHRFPTVEQVQRVEKNRTYIKAMQLTSLRAAADF